MQAPKKWLRGRAGQPGGFPTGPRPGRGLTVPASRRLWWSLLLLVAKDIKQVLAWSGWRRRYLL